MDGQDPSSYIVEAKLKKVIGKNIEINQIFRRILEIGKKYISISAM